MCIQLYYIGNIVVVQTRLIIYSWIDTLAELEVAENGDGSVVTQRTENKERKPSTSHSVSLVLQMLLSDYPPI